MSDRLSHLLHDGAATVDVPAPSAHAVLARGRGLRRRRRATIGLAAVAVLAVVGGGAAAVQSGGVPRTLHDAPPAGTTQATGATFASRGAFAVGTHLHIGDREVTWREPIKALSYTSAGVVVLSGSAAATDAPGPSHYTLVTPGGDRTQVDVRMGDRVAGFEPDSTHMAYAESRGPGWDVVVVDVTTSTELGRTRIAGSYTWGGGEAPPVVIDGDVVWAHLDDGWTEVDWRTGDVRTVPGTDAVSEAANGVYATRDERDTWTVHSMADGTVLGTVPLRTGWYAFFSPDGRFLRSFDNMGSGDDGPAASVYDVRTGGRRDIAGPLDGLGWTPDGHTLAVAGHTVTTCAPMGGGCSTRTFEGTGPLRLGDSPHQS